MNASGLASLLQHFITQRLLEQQGVSSDTVASYRDTFRLLLKFAVHPTFVWVTAGGNRLRPPQWK